MTNEIMTTNSINALANKEIKSNLKIMLQALETGKKSTWQYAFALSKIMSEEQYKEEKLPRLQFFSWNGDPICELLVPFPASSFDIDHSKGKMYFLDRISESINECPLPDYLIWE